MKELINKRRAAFVKATFISLLLFLIVFAMSGPLTLDDPKPLLFLFLFLLVFCIFYFVRELIFFNYNFSNEDRHLINWQYPNGDGLIVTCWGLMKHNTSTPKLTSAVKFDGFKWELDNAKDLAESLIKNEGNPLTALLPSIEFTTTSNRVEDFITFSFVDNINITFIDKDNGFLVIDIEKKNFKTRYSLTYPLPPSKRSLEEESNIFEQRITNRKTPVRGVYLGKAYIDSIVSKE